ncbi:MAG: CofD-related protein of GAK system [Myxococcota bacterium]
MRVQRCLRAPELGPRLLFFSGGTALRGVSRVLKRLTHNSIHLVTPFDSGGSSAVLRDAFGMLSIGDLRNRIMALANESATSNPAVYELFSHRLSASESAPALGDTLTTMVRGTHELVAAVPMPMRRLIRTHLRLFAERMPHTFDLRGASIGNLILVGGFLNHDRDMDSVLFLFSQLIEARGTVLPVVATELHLAADLVDGSTLVGQHLFTGKEVPPITSPIRSVRLVSVLPPHLDEMVAIQDNVRTLIADADLIVFPMGSFYSSVLAPLLPGGVGEAIAAAECPKVFIPSTGVDPEAIGLTVAESVARLVAVIRADAGPVPVERVVNAVLVDTQGAEYANACVAEDIRSQGVAVADLDLAGKRADRLDARKISEALVSLT